MKKLSKQKIIVKALSLERMKPDNFRKVKYNGGWFRPNFISIAKLRDENKKKIGYLYVSSQFSLRKNLYKVGVLSKSGSVKLEISGLSWKAVRKITNQDSLGGYIDLSLPKSPVHPSTLTRKQITALSLVPVIWIIAGIFAVNYTFIKDTPDDVSKEVVEAVEPIHESSIDIQTKKVPIEKTDSDFKPSFVTAEDDTDDTQVAETDQNEVQVQTLNHSENGEAGALLERFGTPGATTNPVLGKAKTQALKDIRKEAENEDGISSIPDPNTYIGRTQNVRMKVPGGGNLKELSSLKSFGLDVE